MKLNDRQNELLTLLQKEERASVAHLAKALYVSEMTVRRDLALLEKEGLLRRYHGGAIANDEYTEYPIGVRMHLKEKEKRALADAAEKHLRDGQLIYMSNSSTAAHVIPLLKKYKDMRVVTNSIQFLFMLSRLSIPCTLTGGEYMEKERCLYGATALECLSRFNPDLAILSCDGITPDGRVTAIDEHVTALERIVVRNAKKIIVLADRSKMGLQFPHTVCHESDVKELIVL